MKFHADHNYKDGMKKNPSAFQKPGIKYSSDLSKENFIKYGRYILGQYVHDNCAITRDGHMPGATETISTLKAYATGKQSVLKYQKILDPSERNEVDEGFMNISWRNHQYLPTFLNYVISKISKSNIGFEVSAIDAVSKKDKIDLINKMKIMASPDAQELIQATGMVPEGMPNMSGINSPQDVDDLVKMGKIITPLEAEMKDAIDESLKSSKYPSSTKPLLIEDIARYGGAAVFVDTLKGTGVTVAERVNLDSLIARYSSNKDFSNIDFAGFIRQRTIKELREQGMSEKELMLAASKYKSDHNNGENFTSKSSLNALLTHGTNEREDYIGRNNRYPEDDFVVDELVFCFVASVTEIKILNDELDDHEDPMVQELGKMHNVYQAKWIVGTDVCYDYGLERNVVRKGKEGHKVVDLPIKIFMTHEPSIVERAIGIIDDIQIATLKKRQAISKMPPAPRQSLDLSKLNKSVQLGKKKYNILELLELYPKTGTFLYSSKKHSSYDQDDHMSQGPPIGTIQSGISEDLAIFANEIAQQIDALHQVTGVNRLVDGSLDNDRLLKDAVAGMRESASNAIEGEFQAYIYLFKSMLIHIMEKWRVAVVSGDIELSSIYGYDKKATKNLFKHMFDINIILLPGEEDKMMMMQKLETVFSANQVDIASYFAVLKLIKEGDIAKAQLLLSKASSEHMNRVQQQEVEKITAQPKAQAEAQAQMLNFEKEKITHETNEKIREIEASKKWDYDIKALEVHGRIKQGEDSNNTSAMIEGMKEKSKTMQSEQSLAEK